MFKRIIIKIGTASLTSEDFSLKKEKINELAEEISKIIGGDKEIILISSGAVAAGRGELEFDEKRGEESLEHRQALAAVGQGILFAKYRKVLKEFGIKSAQVLLNPKDFNESESRKNLSKTLNLLLKKKVIPIINENDTTATEELKFGDNDNLAAKVGVLVKADIIIFLSDVEGFFTKDPNKDKNAKLLKNVEKITPEIFSLAKESANSNALGGMKSKLNAVLFAGENNVKSALVSSNDLKVISKIAKGEDFHGTYFSI